MAPSHDLDAGRRAFLRGAFFSEAGRRGVVPRGLAPPGLSESVLALKDCRTCESAACVPACAEDIIRRHEPGHLLEGRPYLDFESSGCTFCGDCLAACPSVAEEKAGTRRLGVARLSDSACLTHQGVTCISCLPHCEVRALKRDLRGKVSIDEASCTGCGACIAPCPVEALSVEGIAP